MQGGIKLFNQPSVSIKTDGKRRFNLLLRREKELLVSVHARPAKEAQKIIDADPIYDSIVYISATDA